MKEIENRKEHKLAEVEILSKPKNTSIIKIYFETFLQS